MLELFFSGSTREMVGIMQENGEVVATLGSSANFHNMRIFLASDASLAVEPLYPQVNASLHNYQFKLSSKIMERIWSIWPRIRL